MPYTNSPGPGRQDSAHQASASLPTWLADVVEDAKERLAVDYDTIADDLIHFMKGLKTESGFIFVGASMGCGEAVRAFTRSEYIREYCKGMLFLGPSVPLPLQTADNPTAPPRELWDAILAGSCEDRPAFVQASLPNVFSAHVGVGISPTQLNRFQLIVEAADGMAMERLVQIITATDFTDELGVLGSKYDLPVNIVHGDSDNGMPVEASAERVKKLISRAEINFYQKSDHGMYLTHKEECLADILVLASKLCTLLFFKMKRNVSTYIKYIFNETCMCMWRRCLQKPIRRTNLILPNHGDGEP